MSATPGTEVTNNLVTWTQLRDVYLPGVRLTDAKGQAFSDSIYEIAIQNAVSWFELNSKVHVTPTIITNEQHDYRADEYLHFAWFQLYQWPVLSVQTIQATYPTGQTILVFPSPWVKLYNNPGQINLVPTAGTLTQVLIGQGGTFLPLLNGRLTYLPQLFQITYTVGFAQGQIPPLVNETIALRAAIHIMSLAGSMVIEPGIGNKSISVDGLSQSVAAMVGQFGPYSGRINEYNDRIEKNIVTITEQFMGIRMTVI